MRNLEDRTHRATAWKRSAAWLLVGLCLVASAGATASARDAGTTDGPSFAGSEVPPDARWAQFEVRHHSFSKKMRFLNVETSAETVVKAKGIPYSRMTPVNIFVNPDVFEKRVHKARYRLTHPLTGEGLVLSARFLSRRTFSVPERSDDTAPVIRVYRGDEEDVKAGAEAFGGLTYDYHSPILFRGELNGRRMEIERLDEGMAAEKGIWKHLLFPFPLNGDFVVRVEGREVARFHQYRQNGAKTRFDLALLEESSAAVREDASLAFVIFGLMKDFVE